MKFTNSFLYAVTILIVITASGYPALAGDEEDLAKRLEEIGQKAVEDNLANLRSSVAAAGQDQGEDGRYLVSTEVSTFKDVDKEVLARIAGRREAIKSIIWETATAIENEIGAEVGLSYGKLSTSGRVTEQLRQLQEAQIENNISVRSMALTMNMMVEITQELYSAAEKEEDSGRKYDLYVEYTATAYEIADIVLEIFDDFEIAGRDDLKNLYEDRVGEVERIRRQIESRLELNEEKYSDAKISENEFNASKAKLTNWLNALEVSLEGWDNVFVSIDEQSEWSSNLKKRSSDIRDLRDEAGLQLQVLAELGIARTVLESLSSMSDLTAVSSIPLLRLDADVARELLGLAPFESEGDGTKVLGN